MFFACFTGQPENRGFWTVMIKTSFLNPQNLPLVVEPEGDGENNVDFAALSEITRAKRDFFREKLLAHGALLFRGYRVRSVSDLERLVRKFSGGEKLFSYAGGVSPRNPLGGGKRVYTSTE